MNLLKYNHILLKEGLESLRNEKLLINTLNAYSFVTAAYDHDFQNALLKSDVLLPDGISIVLAMKFLKGEKFKKIAGADLFAWEMERLQTIKGKCFFLGSSERVLSKMYERCKLEYPDVAIESYSPPYKAVFSDSDNNEMIEAVNKFSPDVLFIGMTAPKQEKWAAQNFDKLNVKHVGCIGAVFDFYAGTVTRSPKWIINLGFEWFYRLVREPKRLWKRYLIGNTKFIYFILKEKWLTTFSRG